MLIEDIRAVILDRESRGRRPRYHKSKLSMIHQIADGIIVLSSLWLAYQLTDAPWSPNVMIAGVIGLSLFYALGTIKNLYRSWRIQSIRAEVGSVLETWLGVTGISLLAVYARQDAVDYPPTTMFVWFLGAAILLGLWHIGANVAVHQLRARGYNLRRLAIAGSGDLAQHLARTIQGNPWMGFQILGLYDELGVAAALPASRANQHELLDSLVNLTRCGEVDVVFIALPPGRSEQEADTLVRKLADSTASVYVIQDRRSRDTGAQKGSLELPPDSWRVNVLHRRIVDVAGIKAVSVFESPFLGTDGWLKRLEDILVSSIALVLLALPMAAIAVGVKLSSPGPIVFKQRRYGLDGKPILVWKFRSMTVCEDANAVIQARKNDARVTPFGGFLRRTSLDELPQLVNVLLGSMSIVGPRPHAVTHNEYYRKLIGGYMLRHKVKPGITGWAQVNGWRGETDSLEKMGRRVDFDLDYIRNWSIWLDIQIILMTFVWGFVHKNAY